MAFRNADRQNMSHPCHRSWIEVARGHGFSLSSEKQFHKLNYKTEESQKWRRWPHISGTSGGRVTETQGFSSENSLLRVWSVWSMRMRVPLCPCACRGQRQTLLGVLLHASPYSCKTGFLTKSGARLGSASPMILLSLPSMWRVTGMCVTNHAQLGTWLLEIELKLFCV